jgi:hypothetical protein
MRPHAKVEEIDRLFRQTLAAGYDGDKPWSAIRRLQRMGLRIIFTKAATWCISGNWLKRARAADILSQLRSRKIAPPHHFTQTLYVEESFALLSQMLAKEQHVLVLMAILFAFGHLSLDAAIPLALPFMAYPNEDVRRAAAYALGAFPQISQAVEALQILADDEDKDVRDWALFAIGTQSDLDTPELRGALARHVSDPYKDAREEAIAGLAKRKDERAVLPLFHLLRSGSYYMHHESDYETLLESERPADGWTVDDMLDRLYVRFHHLLPTRRVADVGTHQSAPSSEPTPPNTIRASR